MTLKWDGVNMGPVGLDRRLNGMLVPKPVNPARKRRYETVVYSVEVK